MTDRELLERAARAVGISGRYRDDWDAIERSDYRDSFGRGEQWRPHRDDGDAFRLMISLSMRCDITADEVHIMAWGGAEVNHALGDDRGNDVRSAIVRAAASMVVGDG